jgi:hypothetical protein
LLDRAHVEDEDTTGEADADPPPVVFTFTPIFDALLAEFELEWPNREPCDRNEWFAPLREPVRNADGSAPA